MATISGRRETSIWYGDYYFHNELILCTWAFSISAITTNINNGASPPESTKLDDEMGHNCKMPHVPYNIFCTQILGLPQGSHTIHRSEKTFQHMFLHAIDALLHYYSVSTTFLIYHLITQNQYLSQVIARFTLLLAGTEACTPHIIKSVWGSNDEARMALGGPRGDLTLIRYCVLTLSKIAINTIYIWMTDPDTPILTQSHPLFSYSHQPSNNTPSNALQNCLRPPTSSIRKGVNRHAHQQSTRTHTPQQLLIRQKKQSNGIPTFYSTKKRS